MKRFLPAVAVLALLVLPQAAWATLIDRGGGLIYDDVLDITWLQNANYALTSGHPDAVLDNPAVPGYMTWEHAVEWVDGLSYYDSVRDVTWTDWRLPQIYDPLLGATNCLSGAGSTYCGFGSPVGALDPNTGELVHLFLRNARKHRSIRHRQYRSLYQHVRRRLLVR